MIRATIVATSEDQQQRLGRVVSQAHGVTLLRTCFNVSEAMADEQDTGPQVLLIDIDHSVDQGIDAVAKAKAARPSLAVLVATALEGNPRVLDALRAGAAGCVMKTASAAEFASSIRHAHHGGSPLPASIARLVLPLFQREKSSSTPPRLVLSPCEEKIIKLLAKSLQYKEIAASLVISPSTVRAHLHTIYNKMKVRTRTEAVARYLEGAA